MAAYANISALILALRYRTGMYDPAAPLDETGMSNVELTEFLDEARREVNQKAQKWTLGSFLTAANTPSYSPTWPTGKIGKAYVFYGRSQGGDCACDFGPFGMPGAVAVSIATGQPVPMLDEMTLELEARYFSMLDHYFPATAEELPDGKVWLYPVPGDAGISVYYWAPVERFALPADVDAEYANHLLDFATFLSCSAQALKAAEVWKVNDGAMVEVWNNPAEMSKRADKALARWNARFNTLPVF